MDRNEIARKIVDDCDNLQDDIRGSVRLNVVFLLLDLFFIPWCVYSSVSYFVRGFWLNCIAFAILAIVYVYLTVTTIIRLLKYRRIKKNIRAIRESCTIEESEL